MTAYESWGHTVVAAGLGIAVAVCLIATAKSQPRHTDKPVATLPPAEYDHVFKGETLIIRRANKAEMDSLCPKAGFKMVTLGCAPVRKPNECQIVLANDDIIEAAGYTAKITLRHEMAHCNGWSINHEGARVPTDSDW